MSGIDYLLENRSRKDEISIYRVSRKSILESGPICNLEVVQSMSGSCNFLLGN